MGRSVVFVIRCNRIIPLSSGSVDEMMRWSWDFLQAVSGISQVGGRFEGVREASMGKPV